MAKSTNDKLLAASIKRNLFLQRFENREVQQIVAMFNDEVLPDIVDKLPKPLRGVQRTENVTEENFRLAQLRKVIREGTVYANLRDKLVDDLVLASDSAAKSLVNTLTKITPIQFDFIAPAPRTLQSLVTKNPFEGDIMGNWWKKLEKSTADDIYTSLRIGLSEGESVPQLVERIEGTAAQLFEDGTAETARRHMEAIVRTSTNQVMTDAREATYKANDDIIKGVQYVATLDGRTTVVCISASEDDIGEGPGVYPIGEGPRPPLHWNCRSTTSPILKSFDELGIPAKELPPSTRASMNGQVPASTTYSKWLRDQDKISHKTADKVLGPTRASLWRKGEVTIDQFQNDKGELLTLKQLDRIT